MSNPTPYAYPPNPEPPEPTEPPRSPHRQRTLLIAAGALVVLVGVGSGIALAETGGSDAHPAAATSTSAAPSPSTSTTAPKGKGKDGAKRRAMRATIVSESGSTWTVRSVAGETVRVTITAHTRFGTKDAPAGRTTFTVGKAVVINGLRTTSGVTANRVRIAAAKPKAATGTPTSVPSPSAS